MTVFSVRKPNKIGTPGAYSRARRVPMSTPATQRRTQKKFLDIPSAAYQAGYSTRQFRRIIEEDQIPVMQIGRKFFIVAQDLEDWKATRGEARFQQALKQLDGWIKQQRQV